jgi:DNA-binding FadR family transcriptional regulator
MRGFDKEGFLKGLGKKAAKADEAEAPKEMADETPTDETEEKSPAMSPGKQLLAAIKANDPEAAEEAIRACHDENYAA